MASDDDNREQHGLVRIIPNFNGVHEGVIPHGDKAEVELALSIRLEIMKGLVPGHQCTARLFEDVEISQQGDTVAVDIKNPAPTPPLASRSGPAKWDKHSVCPNKSPQIAG